MHDTNRNSELKTYLRLRLGPVKNTSDYYDQLTDAELVYIVNRLFKSTGHTMSNRARATQILIRYVSHWRVEHLVEQALDDYTTCRQDLSNTKIPASYTR